MVLSHAKMREGSCEDSELCLLRSSAGGRKREFIAWSEETTVQPVWQEPVELRDEHPSVNHV